MKILQHVGDTVGPPGVCTRIVLSGFKQCSGVQYFIFSMEARVKPCYISMQVIKALQLLLLSKAGLGGGNLALEVSVCLTL